MRMSTVLKAFGIFAVAMSGKAISNVKSDFVPSVTICNDFSIETHVDVLYGQLATRPVVPPQTCKTFSTDENCKPISYIWKICGIYINNKWGLGDVAGFNFYNDNTTKIDIPNQNDNGCIATVAENTFSIYAPVNFTCPDTPQNQQPPRLRN